MAIIVKTPPMRNFVFLARGSGISLKASKSEIMALEFKGNTPLVTATAPFSQDCGSEMERKI